MPLMADSNFPWRKLIDFVLIERKKNWERKNEVKNIIAIIITVVMAVNMIRAWG